MRILLVQPFKDPGLMGESYPPIGLGYLASSLRQDKHEVFILDCLKHNYNYTAFIQDVKRINPDLIGINLFSISVPFVNKMVDLLRVEFTGKKIVLGGPHVSALPERILTNFKKVDFAVRGEGEIPFRQLINNLSKNISDYNSIPGLIYRKGKAIVINEPYFAKNIEQYNLPAWDLINPPEYFKYLSVGHNSVPVFFSRGCPFPCTFCAAKVTSGQNLRRRSIEHIFQELSFLQGKYNIKRFIIEDEGFGTNKKFIMDFCRKVKETGFKAKFAMGVGMRLDIVDKELLKFMKESNFERTIVLGIESGTERILNLMKKNTNIKMIMEKVDLMNRMGFKPNGYFIIGFPSESRTEIEKTIKFALDLNIREASFTAFQPLPATEATRSLIENGELPQDYDFTSLAQNKITYAPDGITTKELEEIRKSAILRFYLRPKILIRYFCKWNSFMYAFKKVISVFLKKNV